MRRHKITATPWDYRSADLTVKESSDGEWVYFKDVARLEKAARSMLNVLTLDTKVLMSDRERAALDNLAKALEDIKMTDKHFPLAVGQRVTVKGSGHEGIIAACTLDDCKIEFRDGSIGWRNACNVEPGWRSEAKLVSVEPLSYAIVSPRRETPTTGKVVARVGYHTPVLAPFVCVKLMSDAPNRIGDTLDFDVDAEKGAIEVVRAEQETSAALKRSRDIETAALNVVSTFERCGDSAAIDAIDTLRKALKS